MDELVDKINDGKYPIPSKLQLSIESIGFINSLLLNDFTQRMTWKEIGEHPFIRKHPSEFAKIDITKVDKKYKNKNELILDSKNVIWTQLQANNNVKLAFINGSEAVENKHKKKDSTKELPKEKNVPKEKISNENVYNYTNQDFFNKEMNKIVKNDSNNNIPTNKESSDQITFDKLNQDMDGK